MSTNICLCLRYVVNTSNGGVQRVRGGGKGSAEFIAHGFEHVAVVGFNGLSQQFIVPVEGLLHGIRAASPDPMKFRVSMLCSAIDETIPKFSLQMFSK